MASFKFKNCFINNWSSIVGLEETNSAITGYDEVIDDNYYGCKTFEHAEVKMQEAVINRLTKCQKPNLIIGGDLINQDAITSYNAINNCFPYLGLYSACATFNQSLILAGLFVEYLPYITCITSSHNLTAEKQFRFPVEYGSPKPLRSTYTFTGAIGVNLSAQKGPIKLESGTIGCVSDAGIKDVYNMGAVMAPAAFNTLMLHLQELNRNSDYYDLILTGDLGKVGEKIFKELLKSKEINVKKYLDAGTLIYRDEEKTKSGASGPTVLAYVALNKIIKNKKYRKILLLGTGSLHSPVMVNQHDALPAICHAVSWEVLS